MTWSQYEHKYLQLHRISPAIILYWSKAKVDHVACSCWDFSAGLSRSPSGDGTSKNDPSSWKLNCSLQAASGTPACRSIRNRVARVFATDSKLWMDLNSECLIFCVGLILELHFSSTHKNLCICRLHVLPLFVLVTPLLQLFERVVTWG